MKVALIILVCVSLGFTQQPDHDLLWKKYRDAAMQASEQGQRQEAEKFLRAAVAEAETFGPQDPRLPQTLSQLASATLTVGATMRRPACSSEP